MGGSWIVKFLTDVEDQYFDRVKEPGEMQIGLLNSAPNEKKGGDQPGAPKEVQEYLNVVKSSPLKGTIRVHVEPTEEVAVDDAVRLRASLSSPNGALEEIFMVKITEPEKKAKTEKPGDDPNQRLGLPTPVMAIRNRTLKALTAYCIGMP